MVPLQIYLNAEFWAEPPDPPFAELEHTAHRLSNVLPIAFRTYCTRPFETVRGDDDEDEK